MCIRDRTWLGRVAERTGANVRGGTGASFSVVDTLANDALVEVIGQNGEWLEIGANRWVHQRLVKPVAVRFGIVGGTNDVGAELSSAELYAPETRTSTYFVPAPKPLASPFTLAPLGTTGLQLALRHTDPTDP